MLHKEAYRVIFMRFLIIGASGFIGKHIISYAKASGYEAIGTQPGQAVDGSELITYDITKHKIKDCVEPDFLKKGDVVGVICAAISKIDACFKDKQGSHELNVDKTIECLNEMVELGIKPVFLSSSAVFNGKKGYYDESDKPKPVCEYGMQKREVEKFILKNIPSALIFRLDKIIEDDPLDNQLLSEWLRFIQENKTIACIKGNTLAPTCAKDIAKAAVLASEKNLSGLYHVANSEFFTRDELARQFAFSLGDRAKKAKVIVQPLARFNFLDKRAIKTYLYSDKFIKATGMRFTPMKEVFSQFIMQIK